MLTTGLLITEFLASNSSTLDDGDGNSSDWIEVYNPTAATVDLSGWHLTDNDGNLDKWTFPTSATVSQDVLNLDPGEFLIVFASGQDTEDYIDPEGNLHTDFRLSAGGEYLALVQPGGVVVEHEYSPEFPPQTTDISYGLSFDSSTSVLIPEGADAQYIVPTGPINNWNELSFDDSGWSTGATGIGYENSPEDFDAFIETTLPDGTQIPGGTDTAYLRQTFQVSDPASTSSLTLHLRYDDGFLAYLNGELVASENAPANPQWNSFAPASHSDSDAVQFQPFDISEHVDELVPGENVLAIQALNRDTSSDMLIEAMLETSVNSLQMPLDEGIFVDPTPRAANGESFEGVVEDVTVSVPRGFYESFFTTNLVSPTPGATLVYTTDGSEPSLTNGVKVVPADEFTSAQTSIFVRSTTSLRAAAFKADHVTLGPTTHTYVFVSSVISSEVMDTDITQDPEYAPLMRQALLDIPTLSFNYENEIVDSNVPEQRASVEWLAPDGSDGFQIDAGIHGFGGYFTNFAKKNFRLHFRSRYGASRLDFPLFEGFDNGIPATESFDQLNFRSGSHDMSQRGFYMSNRFVDDTLLDLGHNAPHGRFVHIYVNGTYWGQYHMRERWNADFLAQYYGGDDDDYEAVNGNVNNGNNTPDGWSPGDVYDGEGNAWDHINTLTGNYQSMKQFVDMENYIDYMLLYMAGSAENEYRAGGSADGSVPYTFFHNDADGWLRGTGDRTGNAGPGNILGSLLAEGDPDFLTLYRDRIQNMFFNDGALTPEKSTARLQERLDEIELSFLAESARWGYRTPESWENAANDALENMLPQIASEMIDNFRAAGTFPVDAPEFNQYGGAVPSGFELGLTSGVPQLVNNLALFKPAIQSSDLPGYSGSAAVNGSTTDFTHTDSNGDSNPWLEVDLQSESLIETIVVHNRDDGCCTDRFYNISVEIRDVSNQVIHTTTVFNPIPFGGNPTNPGDFVEYDLTGEPGGGVTGRYIRVRKVAIGQGASEEVLSVGELQVYGETPTSPGTDGIYYTTDGSDPRLPGGAVNTSSALLYDEMNPPVITDFTTIRTRSLFETLWSPINEATFSVGMPADFDLDNDVDTNDLAVWQTGYGISSGAATTNGDADADGDVDGSDFLNWQRGYTGAIGAVASDNSVENGAGALQTSVAPAAAPMEYTAVAGQIAPAVLMMPQVTVDQANEQSNVWELYDQSFDQNPQALNDLWLDSLSDLSWVGSETPSPELEGGSESSPTNDEDSPEDELAAQDLGFEEYFPAVSS